MKYLPLVVAAAALALSGLMIGCAKNIDNPEMVKQGIIKDIGKKVDVENMDVNVDSVSFRDKTATATVSFKPKGGTANMSMTMRYNMVRQGDEWHVKDRDMASHEQSQPPAGGTGAGSGMAGPITPGAPLPPGHPTTGGSGTGLGAGSGTSSGASSGGGPGIAIPMPMPITPGTGSAGPIPSGSGHQLPAGHPQLQ